MDKINFILALLQRVKALFWRNNDIIYLNSNKKIFDFESIDSTRSINKTKIIDNQRTRKNYGFRYAKWHFFRMRILLYQMRLNLKYNPQITYTGYVSTPFAIYDGYIFGDNHNYTFYDTSKNAGKPYKVLFNKLRKKQNIFNIPQGIQEFNLLISSSFNINKSFLNGKPYEEFNITCPDKITKDYLSEVFYYVSDFMDACRDNGINIVNIYSATRQPISFVIGTSIQSHHPLVKAYEFEKSSYTWNVEIQNNQLKK